MTQSFLIFLAACLSTVSAAPVASAISPDQQATKIYSLSGSLYGAPTLVGPHPSFPSPTNHEIVVDFAPHQKDNEPTDIWLDFTDVDTPQPIRGSAGGTIATNQNIELTKQNADTFAPPLTDKGDVAQLKWPMSLSHSKLGKNRAGWSRQQNIEVMPVATDFAGVNMRLEAGAYRELHWHKAAEWALVLNGSLRVQAIDADGKSFIDDVGAGGNDPIKLPDVWFFPSGIPHSLQGLENGTEFMLVFDDGEFSEDNTFLVTEQFLLTPKEVLSKNFQLPVKSWNDLPKQSNLFIFNGTEAPANIEKQNVTGPAGAATESYTFHWSQQEPLKAPGGTVKIIDSGVFPLANNFAAAQVTIHPGAMREIHWHPTSDEWSFFISGQARITVYAAGGNSRTFDYQAGDVGYIPHGMSHYIENTGHDDVVMLEVIQGKKFQDISLGQWLALTPAQIVQDHLGLSDKTLEGFSKIKPFVVNGPVPPATVQ